MGNSCMENKILIGAIVVLVLVVSGCAGTTTTPAKTTTPTTTQTTTQTTDTGTTGQVYSGTAQVEIEEDFEFHPAVITVERKTTVTWTNRDTQRHSVTFDDIVVGSSVMWRGDTFSYKFSEPGTFNYHCTQHINTKGVVIVR